jgi:heat shock protein HslJ
MSGDGTGMSRNRLPNVLIIVVVILIAIVALIFVRGARNQGAPATAVPTADSEAAIQNIVWQWTQLTNRSTGEVTGVPNPASYTLIFHEDGSFTGMADCNEISGSYSTRDGFSVAVRSSTRAFCGEESLDTLYLSTLEDVVAGGPDGAGGLALETGGGEQRMQFINGGAAP